MWLLLISILDITLQTIFLVMMISIDNVEHYYTPICSREYYTAKVHVFLGCETHTISYLLFIYVYTTTLVELQKSTITKLQIAYYNIF